MQTKIKDKHLYVKVPLKELASENDPLIAFIRKDPEWKKAIRRVNKEVDKFHRKTEMIMSNYESSRKDKVLKELGADSAESFFDVLYEIFTQKHVALYGEEGDDHVWEYVHDNPAPNLPKRFR